MPTVTAQGKTFQCDRGANLRKTLLANDIDVYNGTASTFNCHGLGTCGTCTVRVEGEVSPMEQREKIRLSLPPHSPESGLRLSCQTKVLGDVRVSKMTGFWGQKSETAWTSEG